MAQFIHFTKSAVSINIDHIVKVDFDDDDAAEFILSHDECYSITGYTQDSFIRHMRSHSTTDISVGL